MGVELGEDAVLGVLDDYPTRSGYRITPVVVWAGGTVKVTPQPSEVERVHVVTLERLARPETPEFASIPESERPLIRLNIARAKVHAPTAAVLYQFREVCLFGRETRVAHLAHPVFAFVAHEIDVYPGRHGPQRLPEFLRPFNVRCRILGPPPLGGPGPGAGR